MKSLVFCFLFIAVSATAQTTTSSIDIGAAHTTCQSHHHTVMRAITLHSHAGGETTMNIPNISVPQGYDVGWESCVTIDSMWQASPKKTAADIASATAEKSRIKTEEDKRQAIMTIANAKNLSK
jgi:hypothetical protein